MLATTALGILLGYLSKTPCTGPTFDQFGISPNLGLHKYDKLCYSDVQQLWVGRGVPEHTFPYLHGKLVDDPTQPQGNLVDGAVEYPIVTGVFMWFAGLFARRIPPSGEVAFGKYFSYRIHQRRIGFIEANK